MKSGLLVLRNLQGRIRIIDSHDTVYYLSDAAMKVKKKMTNKLLEKGSKETELIIETRYIEGIYNEFKGCYTAEEINRRLEQMFISNLKLMYIIWP